VRYFAATQRRPRWKVLSRSWRLLTVLSRRVRLVRESEGSHGSPWAALVSVSGKIGCTAEPLGRWVREAEIDAGVRPGVTSDMVNSLPKRRGAKVLKTLGGWEDGAGSIPAFIVRGA
jgi:hypothetical protein